ncbi:vascular endothelial zinc finger 1 isoform X6 [Gadus morhua]|uniref:vascular endothelial zinc finger 1 isoform X6 n=1 Tax=Gadus morhua TaxID=8049 RepID=UPI0011B733A2|nr:vascular endothelial zinc finger 1-like isoform X6 [Gadus morhua]XP_056466641.1 vascular endothelial zinc finger 1-like isoform X6 [Gadus chalcogrammus]XP_059931545.1 vascular endothelial zinc finger 1-like isoform X6 [Gadus macrocephalus]
MEPSWSTFLFQQANEALHHQHHAVGNGLLPLLNSEPTDQKPVLPILMEQKPQNSSHSYISTVAGILTTATTSTGTGAVAPMQHQHQHGVAKKPPKPVKKNHGCDMCGKAFRDVYHLNRHKLSHSDEKPFECPICQQRFKRKDRMTCHVRSHNGAVHKPYICSVCGKGFSRPDHLSCHVKHVHSSERPFKCQVTACTSAFATKDRLRSHMIRHEGKVTCNICGKMLSAAYITSHLKTHGQAGFSSTACTNKGVTDWQWNNTVPQKGELTVGEILNNSFQVLIDISRTQDPNIVHNSTPVTPVTNPSTMNRSSNSSYPVTIAAQMNISKSSPGGHLQHPGVTITGPISLAAVSLPAAAHMNLAHPLAMNLSGPLNMAMRPMDNMSFLSQVLPSCPPW